MGHETQRRALISGISGQDGSYLAELLLSCGYSVHGIIRRSSITARPRIDHLRNNSDLHLHYGDVLDAGCLHRLFAEIRPDEIYHLAAQSQVHVSFGQPDFTSQVDYLGTLHMLEAFRLQCPQSKFYQASSSEIFGSSPPPQRESTPFAPCSPYGIAKLASHWLARMYREAYGLFVCCGILFNHESPRRGESFVSRKITQAVARARLGWGSELSLGNLDAKRDWMHAHDAVRAMQMMMVHDEPDDFVIASGESRSVFDFLILAAREAKIAVHAPGYEWQHWPNNRTPYVPCDPLEWSGDTLTIKTDPAYLRPLEVAHLCGDAGKARRMLGWEPQYTLEQLVEEMVKNDLELEGKA